MLTIVPTSLQRIAVLLQRDRSTKNKMDKFFNYLFGISEGEEQEALADEVEPISFDGVSTFIVNKYVYFKENYT